MYEIKKNGLHIYFIYKQSLAWHKATVVGRGGACSEDRTRSTSELVGKMSSLPIAHATVSAHDRVAALIFV